MRNKCAGNCKLLLSSAQVSSLSFKKVFYDREEFKDFLTDFSLSAFYFKAKEIRVTVTAGMCTGSSLSDYEAVIQKADERLYYGKRNGKNRVVKSD